MGVVVRAAWRQARAIPDGQMAGAALVWLITVLLLGTPVMASAAVEALVEHRLDQVSGLTRDLRAVAQLPGDQYAPDGSRRECSFGCLAEETGDAGRQSRDAYSSSLHAVTGDVRVAVVGREDTAWVPADSPVRNPLVSLTVVPGFDREVTVVDGRLPVESAQTPEVVLAVESADALQWEVGETRTVGTADVELVGTYSARIEDAPVWDHVAGLNGPLIDDDFNAGLTVTVRAVLADASGVVPASPPSLTMWVPVIPEEVKDPLGTATELRGVGGREFDVLGLRLRLTSSAPDVLEAAALASRHVLVTAAAFLVVALTAAVLALVMVMRLMADAHSDFLRVLRARGASGGAVWWVRALIRLRVVGLAVVAGVVTVVLAARYGLENGRWVSLAEAGRVVSTISSLELSGTDLVARVATLVGVVAVTSVVGVAVTRFVASRIPLRSPGVVLAVARIRHERGHMSAVVLVTALTIGVVSGAVFLVDSNVQLRGVAESAVGADIRVSSQRVDDDTVEQIRTVEGVDRLTTVSWVPDAAVRIGGARQGVNLYVADIQSLAEHSAYAVRVGDVSASTAVMSSGLAADLGIVDGQTVGVDVVTSLGVLPELTVTVVDGAPGLPAVNRWLIVDAQFFASVPPPRVVFIDCSSTDIADIAATAESVSVVVPHSTVETYPEVLDETARDPGIHMTTMAAWGAVITALLAALAGAWALRTAMVRSTRLQREMLRSLRVSPRIAQTSHSMTQVFVCAPAVVVASGAAVLIAHFLTETLT